MNSSGSHLRALEGGLKHIAAASLRGVLGSQAPSAFQPQSTRRILVIRQHNQLGDMLCVVPLLRALRSHCPHAQISLLTSPVNHDIMLNNRYLDDVINFDKQEFSSGGKIHIGRLVAYIRKLRNERFDLAVVPSTVSTSFTSDLFAYLSGAGIRIGAGSTDGRENPSGFFFNVPVDLNWTSEPHRHQTLRNLDILARYVKKPDDLTSEITLTTDERLEGKSFVTKYLNGKTSRIVFHPGAGKIPNRWPGDRFAAVANTLSAEFDSAVFITAGPMDDEPVAVMRSGLHVRAQLIMKQPIRPVASILKNMDLVVTNDTGIMHVAAAVGARVLSLFGPTDPGQWAPLGEKNRYIHGSGGDIRSISIEDVLRNAREMLRVACEPKRDDGFRSSGSTL